MWRKKGTTGSDAYLVPSHATDPMLALSAKIGCFPFVCSHYRDVALPEKKKEAWGEETGQCPWWRSDRPNRTGLPRHWLAAAQGMGTCIAMQLRAFCFNKALQRAYWFKTIWDHPRSNLQVSRSFYAFFPPLIRNNICSHSTSCCWPCIYLPCLFSKKDGYCLESFETLLFVKRGFTVPVHTVFHFVFQIKKEWIR